MFVSYPLSAFGQDTTLSCRSRRPFAVGQAGATSLLIWAISHIVPSGRLRAMRTTVLLLIQAFMPRGSDTRTVNAQSSGKLPLHEQQRFYGSSVHECRSFAAYSHLQSSNKCNVSSFCFLLGPSACNKPCTSFSAPVEHTYLLRSWVCVTTASDFRSCLFRGITMAKLPSSATYVCPDPNRQEQNAGCHGAECQVESVPLFAGGKIARSLRRGSVVDRSARGW